MADLELYRLAPRRSRLQRMIDSVRGITLGPWNPKDPAIARFFGGRQSAAGVPVNEHTSMNYSAVWNAVAIIAEQIAAVPLKLYKPSDDKRGKTPFVTHPLYKLLHDRPNPHMGSFVFRRHVQASKLLWGNGYAEIERDTAGRPFALWPLLPWAVQPFYESNGSVKYRVANPNGTTIELDSADVIHIRGQSTGNGLYGDPPIPAARESFGLALAAERFGATFFGNGSTFGGIVTYPTGVTASDQVKKDNREALERMHQGPDRAHRFLALYEGATYTAIGIPPNAGQFLETRVFQIEEVCRWFNLPPHKLKQLQRTTNASIEQQSIEFVTDTLDPHWVDWEEELTAKLISPLEKQQQIIEHVREGLLRGDTVSRAEYYSKLFNIGGITLNEIRERENFPPMAGGDTPFVPANLLPLDRLTEFIDATIEAKKPKPPAEPALPKEPPQAPPPEKKWDEAIADIRAMYESQIAATITERDEARAAVVAAKAETVSATDLANTTIAERDDARTRLEESERFRNEAHNSISEWRERCADHEAANRTLTQTINDQAARVVEQEKAVAVAREASTISEREREAARAECEQADRRLGDSMRAREEERAAASRALEQVTAELDAVLPVRDALQIEAETLRTELAQARKAIADTLEHQRAQRTAQLASMRSLFADATDRLLAKEATASRKHQQTAEKLREWTERFYVLHADTVREVFRPIVGPWTALTGGAPSVLLDRLIEEHLQASRHAWAHVLEADGDDQRAELLERTLLRWERERADEMADALLREGMEGHE